MARCGDLMAMTLERIYMLIINEFMVWLESMIASQAWAGEKLTL